LLLWKLFSDGDRDGEFFIREIREIRGSIPLVAAGGEAPSRLCAFALDSSCGLRMGRKAAADDSTAAESRARPLIIKYSTN
jgi:hypothetical protein